MTGLLAAAADLLLGVSCQGCGSPGRVCCADCRSALTDTATYLTRPDPCPANFPLTVAAGAYDERRAGLITAHKDGGSLTLAAPLGRTLARSVTHLLRECGAAPGSGSAPVVLVPVPSAAAAVRERGLDAAHVLARRAAAELRRAGCPTTVRRLVRRRGRQADQGGLTAVERRSNLVGRFVAARAAGRWSGPVVLVDDVVTTGSSLAEANRALLAAGVPVLGAATVAATVRRIRRPG